MFIKNVLILGVCSQHVGFSHYIVTILFSYRTCILQQCPYTSHSGAQSPTPSIKCSRLQSGKLEQGK